MARLTIPRDVYYGEDAIENLSVLKGHKKAFVVTGTNFMIDNGYLEKVKNLLHDNGMEVKVFDKVESNPLISTVYRGAEQMCEWEPDVIVSLGGGSPTDSAKAMWIFYENPELKFDDIKTPYSLPKQSWSTTCRLSSMETPAMANVSALAVLTDTGISSTRSAPHRSAISARRCLGSRAGVPLCT